MKSYLQEEGLNFSTEQYFGDPGDHLPEFGFIVRYEVSHFVADNYETRLYYRITEDGYLQICSVVEEMSARIIAQYHRSTEPLMSQIRGILKSYYTGARYYGEGYPESFIDGALFTREEFEGLLAGMDEEFRANRIVAQDDPPDIVTLMNSHNLSPIPDGRDITTWMCTCPYCRKTLLTFNKNSESWYCRYCNVSGKGFSEFKKMIEDVERKEAERSRQRLAEKRRMEEEEASAANGTGGKDSELTEEEKRWLFWISNF